MATDSILKELRAHLRRLKSPRWKWVNCAPRQPGECCAIWWRTAGGKRQIGLRAEVQLERTLRPNADPSSVSIAYWNDQPGRTRADVIALLERAIAKHEKEADGVD